MNEGTPLWAQALVLLSVLQVAILAITAALLNSWFSKLNRKLHRIESNTRATLDATAPQTPDLDARA